MTATVPVSRSLKQRLKQVCTELKSYRRSRGISASLLAKKASITRVTLNKLEQGDIGVSVGIWLKVLSVLESTDKFFDLLSTAVTKKAPIRSNLKKSTKATTKNNKVKAKAKTKTKVKPSSKTKTKKLSTTKTKVGVKKKSGSTKPKTRIITRSKSSKKRKSKR